MLRFFLLFFFFRNSKVLSPDTLLGIDLHRLESLLMRKMLKERKKIVLLLLENILIASSSSVDLLMQLIFNRIQIFQYLGQIAQSSQE